MRGLQNVIRTSRTKRAEIESSGACAVILPLHAGINPTKTHGNGKRASHGNGKEPTAARCSLFIYTHNSMFSVSSVFVLDASPQQEAFGDKTAETSAVQGHSGSLARRKRNRFFKAPELLPEQTPHTQWTHQLQIGKVKMHCCSRGTGAFHL